MPTSFVKRLIVFCLVLVLLPATAMSAAPVIKDVALTKVIRTTLKISSKKEVKLSDLKKLKSIYAEDTKNKNSNLQGLENAVNLVDLILPGHNIKNITPLSKLKKIEFLVLEGNQIKDLSPLSGLSRLESLLISGNQIKNLAPLKNLHKLTSLLASGNQVADLGPLQKLNVEWIIMNDNKIQDLTPLKNHPTLEYLYVEDNLIQDIEVLETIPHLTEVSLAGNPLNEQAEQVVKNLEKKGIIVSLEKEDEE
jgi:internalin A